ncbi:AMP-binding protein [Escherichia coli]|nr:AMP-binding protein [Escherichia coli]EES1081665.1 AMP-binding protein [Escherichia coli]EES4203421.1 AMP-binding protein [Escherichia coli]EES8478054.1 AMP-binding protein [Escherichia coli]EEY2023751.1 AMP-binding protein [Escherichia coli]
MSFSEFYQRSINEPEQFWAEQARRIDWQTPFTQTLDHSNPPFARWFCEGRTNLCHNAIDRWLEKQPEALALIAVSSETEEERTFTFRQLHDEVNAVASMLRSLGVQRGDRVLVYMPMIAEAHITLLACARIGAIHSVVFGGFASHSVAARIDDAKPVLIVSADAGARGGKIIPYKKLLDDAISQAQHQPRHVLLVDRGLDDRPTRLGSPGVPMYGYNVQLLNEVTGEPCGVNEKGMLVVEGPLPPGCIQTIWGDDDRFVKTYWSLFSRPVYATFDWGIRDADGYHFILGRTDDVINVAGHRLGTREIEESISSHPGVAEVAVVGVKDALKGQVAVAFVIPKESDSLEDRDVAHSQEKAIMALVDSQIGNFGRPAHVWFVSQLPKTRSGKMLRRTIQAICEGRDPGDLTTIDDPASLNQIRQAMEE